MTLKINDTAPNFDAETTKEKLIYMTGLVTAGLFYSRILKTLLQFVQRNLELFKATRVNLIKEM